MDGYNIIFAWDELNALAKESLDAARRKLMDILCNYQGYQKCVLILVFDAYKVPGGLGEVLKVEGEGDNAKATIRFKNAGDKQLLLRFARFKVIG